MLKRSSGRKSIFWRLAIAGLCLFVSAMATAGEPVVLAPKLEGGYRDVFLQVVSGMEESIGHPLRMVNVAADMPVGELQEDLRREGASVVIALGRSSTKMAGKLSSEFAVVSGGLLVPERGVTRNMLVSTMAPDPALLFTRLGSLQPGTKRIFVVINPAQNAWVLALAREAAHDRGIELVVYKARELRGAMQAYHEIVDRARAGHDAIWLPLDATTVEDGSVLPYVMNEAWARNLTVFSSSVEHVRRGVLFSLYPDNRDMGRSLGRLALEALAAGPGIAGILPLRDARMMVNQRTARHLGLSEKDVLAADMVFRE